MTPPINFGGDTVNAITIDGTSVSEVTVDGSTVFGGIPDSVILPESGDMQYFTGDTDQMDILDTTQDSAINDGPYRDLALMENNNGDNMRNGTIISTSGLNTYPEAGQILTWIQSEPDYASDNGAMATFFGVQDGSNWYGAGLDPNDLFYIQKDADDKIRQEASPSIDPGVWYEIEINWGTDGTIAAKIFDIDQSNGGRLSELASISFNDTEYTSGGIGVGNKGPTGGGYAMQEFRVD